MACLKISVIFGSATHFNGGKFSGAGNVISPVHGIFGVHLTNDNIRLARLLLHLIATKGKSVETLDMLCAW
jgi:hypothetical protein